MFASGMENNKLVLAIVVMGVSGCGKSTVGEALAEKLGAVFFDADDFHPENNKEKMRAGIALNDDDRGPWLALLNAKLRENCAAGISTVLACSALKQAYRDALCQGLAVSFVHLTGTQDEIAARLAQRNHEYMPATLLASQFSTLENPTDALQIPIVWSLDEQVSFAVNSFLSHN